MIDLTRVSSRISNEQTIDLRFLIPSAILLFLSLAIGIQVLESTNTWANFLFYLIPGTILLAMALSTYYPSINIHTDDGSVAFPFFGNKKKMEASAYVQFVLEERRRKIIEFYTRFSRGISYERQLENIIALYQNVLISQEEFEGYKSQLDLLFSNKSIEGTQ